MQAADRFRRRLSEVTAFSAIVATRAPPASAKGGAGGDPPTALARASAAANGAATGGGGKQQGGREAELEELVTGLRRVTEKQKVEIDRLRKQPPHATPAPTGSSSSGLTTAEAADPAKALRAAKAEAAHLHKRLAAAEEAARGADSVRRQLATAEAELRSLGAAAGTGGRGRPAAHGSLQAHGHAGGGGGGGGPSDHGGADEPSAAAAARLAAENEQLRAELAAFDLDFFGAWGGRQFASVP